MEHMPVILTLAIEGFDLMHSSESIRSVVP
jgi:hypothetical protein